MSSYRVHMGQPRIHTIAKAAAATLLRPRSEHQTYRKTGEREQGVSTNGSRADRPQPSVCVVIPAHNEAARVANVLRSVIAADLVDRVIVVNDGSTDRTSDVVREFEPQVTLIELTQNRGKGGAMLAGAAEAEGADVLLFLDGDLQNLTPAHVNALVKPVVDGRAEMAIGQFRGGRGLTDLAQLLVPYISGQRAIKRDLFLAIPGLGEVGYGIEMAITLNVKRMKAKVCSVTIRGVTHPMKEEKLGFVRGALSRMRMYAQMARFTISYLIKQR